MFQRLLRLLISFPSRVKLWIAGAGGLLALFALLKVYIWGQKKEAVEDFKQEQVLKGVKVRKDAKKVGNEEKRSSVGLSDGDLIDRVRGRDNDWDRL